ncbi:hypothetical protein ACWXVT_01230 [Mycoplasma sp. 1573]
MLFLSEETANTTQEVATKENNNNLAQLVVVLALIISAWMAFKIVSYFKKSLQIYQAVQGEKLRIKHTYGLKKNFNMWVSPVIAFALLLAIFIAGIVFLAIELTKKEHNSTLLILYSVWAVVSVGIILATSLSMLLIYRKVYSSELYQNKNWSSILKGDLTRAYGNNEYVEITLDEEGLKTKNSMLYKALSQRIDQYRLLGSKSVLEQYKTVLDINFVAEYLPHYVSEYTLYGNVFNTASVDDEQNIEPSTQDPSIREQIAWMNAIDNKFSAKKDFEQSKANLVSEQPRSSQTRKIQKANLYFINTNEFMWLSSEPFTKINVLVNNERQALRVHELLKLISTNAWIKLKNNL